MKVTIWCYDCGAKWKEAEPLAQPIEALEATLPDEDRMQAGGWFREDFALRYRPTGHADAFIRAWLDATAATPLRRTHLANQLIVRLVHIDHRTIRIVRAMIHLQNVLHVRHKFGILLGRNAPTLLEPRFQLVFFIVRRTAS